MDSEQTSYSDLIKAFYTGQISVKEEAELYRALQNDKELKKEFFEFEENYDFPMNQLTKDNWNRLLLREFKLSDRRKTGRVIYIGLRYAAIFLIGFISFWLLQNVIPGKPEPLAESYCELVVPKGQKSQLNLPDGTTVWLNSESRLRYPADFLQGERWADLSGEAFFDVTRNTGKPFVVKTNDFNIKVTGTKFNVMAYEDFDRTEASLEEGKIELLSTSGKVKIAELEPNQKIIFSKEKHEYAIVPSKPEIESSWKNNEFVFENIEFSEFARRLERWYDVEILFADQELSKIRYTGSFKNKETIWQVLDIIKLTTKIEYTLNDRKLIIKKTK
jgi:ferric-dicitrate binding protein FerR (iron transport regulator)